MSSSCSELLGALKTCLLESDCVQKQGRLPSECLKHHTDELPEACQNLRKATYECKRNMLDMRKRFRVAIKLTLPGGSERQRLLSASTRQREHHFLRHTRPGTPFSMLYLVHVHEHAGIDTLDAFPNTKTWMERLLVRPGVLTGLKVL